MASAIVSGALATKPFNGGEAWVRLSWVLGLQRLGFETYFVEELATGNCVDDSGEAAAFSSSINRRYFESVVRDFGLEGHAGLLCDGGRESAGLGLEEMRSVAADADLLINISGHLTLAEILTAPRTRIYVDLDPGFTQAWHTDDRVPFKILGHDHYVTVGLNVGTPACLIPDCGIEWITILPPVLLEKWPPQSPANDPLRFTTVATWRSPYGPLEIGGQVLGLKHHQFRRFIDLPERVPGASFELALDIHRGDSADLQTLKEHGWEVVDPGDVAATPGLFRDYLAASGAEFSAAQEVYAATRSGWFSDRTAAYLACGRPALVQDTGIGERLHLGAALSIFVTPEEAASLVEQIATHHAEHSAAARAFAERHLDSDIVLGHLLAKIGVE